MPRNHYYYYDHEACTFVEVQPRRYKTLIHAAVVLGLALVLAAAGVGIVYQTSTTPKEIALREENRALQQQLLRSGHHFEELAAQLEELTATDRELYRTIFQAEPISEDVRLVGVGGTEAAEFDHLAEPTARLLRDNASALEELERRVALQRQSYAELLRLARERAEALPQMPAILPVSGTLTSGFGVRRHPIHRVFKVHKGVDFSVPIGTPVHATGDGIVEFAGMNSGYGLNVRIRHPKARRVTLYAHLSRVAEGIKPGARVERGQVIAYSGNTGLSTAPHLHYEIHRLDGEAINPVYSFAPGVEPAHYLELVRAAESENAPLD